jgi:hypothetical protein
MNMLAVVPLKPRELGWYATDQYLPVAASAPFFPTPQLQSNKFALRDAPAHIRPASINRSQSFDVAFWSGVFPLLCACSIWACETGHVSVLRNVFRALM